jgi:hypothetical protein
MLLECQDEVLSNKNADLLGIQRLLGFRRTGHDKEVVLVRFDFGTLMDMDNVFEGQWVNPKYFPQFLDSNQVG